MMSKWIFALILMTPALALAKPKPTRVAAFQSWAQPYTLTHPDTLHLLSQLFRDFVKDLSEKDGEQKVFVKTRAAQWPAYLQKNDLIGRKTLKGALEYMAEQCDGLEARMRAGQSILVNTPELVRFLEIHRALLLNFKSPIRNEYSLQYGAIRLIKETVTFPLLRGDSDAENIPSLDADPADSSFWARSSAISAKDLAIGFDRKQTLPQKMAGTPCEYLEAKSSLGSHAGVTLKCGGDAVKIKFGEIRSEPFAARIFWALGFNVDPSDYHPGVEFQYDRRFFKEINSRPHLKFKVSALGIPIGERSITRIVNPFTLLAGAVLKSGERITPARLQSLLLQPRPANLESLLDTDFNPSGEAQVERIITRPVQVQLKTEKSDDLIKVGPWAWEELDHPNRREVRGMVAPSLWLGWYDSRFDNNRLLLVRDKSGKLQLKHVLSDLGSVLGDAKNFLSAEPENLAEFPEHMTKRNFVTGLIAHNVSLLDRNQAFEDATPNDLRWGMQFVNQLTAQQILGAAEAAGFTPSEAQLLRQKLEIRRDHANKNLR